MQQIIIEKPYEFIPPHRGTWWPAILKYYLPRFLRKKYGLERVECRDVDKLRASIDAGHGIVLAPNHCRLSDPPAMGVLSREVDSPFFVMASWHVFMQSAFQCWISRRLGAFSVYREGMDRQAMNEATSILETAERPLVIFPEGVITRTNDLLAPLMDGVAFIARSAAKRRAKQEPAGEVVVHPIAIKYFFHGDIEKSVLSVIETIENRLSWTPQSDLHPLDRIGKVGDALLALKEIEYMGVPQAGDRYERLDRLIDHLLLPLEQEWIGDGSPGGNVVARVKKLRAVIVPDLATNGVDENERQRRWKHLTDMYLAQQLWFYPRQYLSSEPSPERYIEMVEKFEEDLTDEAPVHGPMSAVMQVGDAIPVEPRRERSEDGDPLMHKIRDSLQQMLKNLARESKPAPKSMLPPAGDQESAA
ncbi:MAG: 1-acyl-sn-glycerol-3-phosphate acyltransferase [Pirellulales bacterium]|nr:1-acyl-sn-glycerol-3-phosphate acyltransferase [Pirellulales bacterium]